MLPHEQPVHLPRLPLRLPLPRRCRCVIAQSVTPFPDHTIFEIVSVFVSPAFVVTVMVSPSRGCGDPATRTPHSPLRSFV
jgi:hypothetical protein